MPYNVFDDSFMLDPNLTFAAKGMLVYLIGMGITKPSLSKIQKITNDKTSDLERTIIELKKRGYIHE